jgi:hypothetical protein
MSARGDGARPRRDDLLARRAERAQVGDEILAVRRRGARRVRILLAQDLPHEPRRRLVGQPVDADVVDDGKQQRQEAALQEDLEERGAVEPLDSREEGVAGELGQQLGLDAVRVQDPMPNRRPMFSSSVCH